MKRQIVIYAIGLFATCSLLLAQRTLPAKLTVLIIDRYGKRLDTYVVSSFKHSRKPDVDLAPKFKGNVLSYAELGATYNCVLQHKSNPNKSHTVQVLANNLNTLAVIAIPTDLPSIQFAGPLQIPFIVKPSPHRRGELSWVAVRPVWPLVPGLGFTEATPIDEDGHFVLNGLHGGMYVLTLHRGSAILGSKVLEIPVLPTADGKSIEINLDEISKE